MAAEAARQAAIAEAARQAALAKEQAEARAVAAARTYSVPVNVASTVTLGQQLAAQRGWTGVLWSDTFRLLQMESGWRINAVNASSGACGIGQALPCSKSGPVNSNGTSGLSAEGQINWAYNYIAGRYGNPAVALAHELSFRWY